MDGVLLRQDHEYVDAVEHADSAARDADDDGGGARLRVEASRVPRDIGAFQRSTAFVVVVFVVFSGAGAFRSEAAATLVLMRCCCDDSTLEEENPP
nr:unnamed protein product [Digitaria exilis]